MSVVALVEDSNAAQAIVSLAGRLAAVQDSELVIFFVSSSVIDPSRPDPTHIAISEAIEGIVRTSRARRGRLPRHAVSVRRVTDDDAASGIVSRIRTESPELFVGATLGSALQDKDISITRKIFAKATCDAILLSGNHDRILEVKHLVVATSEGVHDGSAVEMAAKVAQFGTESVTVLCVEASVGQEAVEIGERHLRSVLRDLNIEESSHLRVKAVIAEYWTHAVAAEAAKCDLLLVGANKAKELREVLDETPNATIGIFRRAPRLSFGRRRELAAWLLPQINPADYADLYEKLQSGSRWNRDFIVMLGLAAAIATLGLLQSSSAVVIGSMLLAPLMTPMIGMGLALNQGNSKLAYACFRAIGKGFLATLAISVFLAFVTPGTDLTPEIYARTNPNILDLLIALFSGAAAAYALARPSLAGTIAGVAIATALVPPLCSCGIALAYQQYLHSLGALFLLLANVVAIILAAAATLRAMGLRALAASSTKRFWVRRVVAGLTVFGIIIAIPLGSALMRNIHEGKNAPTSLAVTNELREALLGHIDKMPGVEILFAGRSGIDRESHPVDVGIIVSSTYPLPRSEADKIIQLIRTTMQNPDLRIRVECVVGGWADEPSGDSKIDADQETPN